MTKTLGTDNATTSLREVLDFTLHTPDRYFAYVDLPAWEITTWMGDRLGTITRKGKLYRDNFGGERVPIWVRGNNGRNYQGTYFISSGSYCRLRLLKS